MAGARRAPDEVRAGTPAGATAAPERRATEEAHSVLTHVDAANRPTMVDVGDKAVTQRTAEARAFVVFPEGTPLAAGEALHTKKGPVFDTAIIAGVMAAKKTHEL
ncbi:MAG TPA: cyclic pyranopterin monophosphate synthase MoaC, partial [Gammaproteobacteria bacterium]|nr:cyclic pyranopterin monophosphate synthase MoaC [Gammaproteobacteria bacterium]